MDLGLRDRTYIVTGAGRGLGNATARILVDEGAFVVMSSRSASIDEVATRIDPARACGVTADNGDPATATRLVDVAMSRFGRLDGVLISVGGPTPGSVTGVSDDTWRSAFEAVFLGAVRIATTVAEVLSDGGSIVFVLSTSVKQPLTGLAVSNGLRPGLAMIAKTLADELGPRRIRVNGLLPGRIDTERVRELDRLSVDPAETRASTQAQIPLRRYGDPDEFGRLAAFVLSPAAGYLTGAMIPIDGGLTRAL